MPFAAPALITPATGRTLTMDQIKAHRNFSIAADQESYVSDILLPAAEDHCEETCGLALLPQVREMVLDGFPQDNRDYITIYRPPLITVDSIIYVTDDDQDHTWDPSNYIVDTSHYPGRVALKRFAFWPGLGFGNFGLRPHNSVRIRYTCGYSTPPNVPAKLKQGILLVIGTLFENRESNVVTDRRGTSFPLTLDSATQTALDALWRRYRVGGI